MIIKWIIFYFIFSINCINSVKFRSSYHNIYTNTFAIKVNKHSDPNEIASKLGFINLGSIFESDDYYYFKHPKVKNFSYRSSNKIYSLLDNHHNITWFEQQIINPVRPRYNLFDTTTLVTPLDFNRHKQKKLWKRAKTNTIIEFNDPYFKDEWYLNDMNISKAWSEGYTGKGIVIAILDDGIQADHPDLKENIDDRASIDLLGSDYLPLIKKDPYRHGTRCAGEIASIANNGICGVGVAYNSKIGGIRVLDSKVTDIREARAITHELDYIDIYSASWGPEDNGKSLGGPGVLTKRALIKGITRGRKGLGSIYIWAAGNGGRSQDDCNADGYVNSIYTLTISSVDKDGRKPEYVEHCSCIITTTYSKGGSPYDMGIVTTDLFTDFDKASNHNMCTKKAGGTSASAPIAAGIIALVLQANKNLTWRDIEHLIVETSNPDKLTLEEGWNKNGAGKMYSHKFGFGLMDAASLIEKAKRWKRIPSMNTCITKVESKSILIPEVTNRITIPIHVKCLKKINYIEHVELFATIFIKPRGNLAITLRSPKGTFSKLLEPRPKDRDKDRFYRWKFSSIHFWGEPAEGKWLVYIKNSGTLRTIEKGRIIVHQLIFHGFKKT